MDGMDEVERAARVLDLAVALVGLQCLPTWDDDPDRLAGILTGVARNDSGTAVDLTLRGATVLVEALTYEIPMRVTRNGVTRDETGTEIRLAVDRRVLTAPTLTAAVLQVVEHLQRQVQDSMNQGQDR